VLNSSDKQLQLLGSFENMIGEIGGDNQYENAKIKLSMLNLNDLSKEAISAELDNGKISFMTE
jgi:hypothetical protein